MLSTLIDFADPRTDGACGWRAAFGAPVRVRVAHAPHEVRPVLEAVEALAREGRVGHLRYEAAAAFDPAFDVHAADGPLAFINSLRGWPGADLVDDNAP
ncbi:hypothetical protein FQZ97_1068840 [compost metagenome]